jgi:predicted lipoprotein with Yx(FWY)xxD motif
MRLLAVVALVSAIVAVPTFAAPLRAKVLLRPTTVGEVLVGARGRTLYLRVLDTSRKSTCYSSCASGRKITKTSTPAGTMTWPSDGYGGYGP